MVSGIESRILCTLDTNQCVGSVSAFCAVHISSCAPHPSVFVLRLLNILYSTFWWFQSAMIKIRYSWGTIFTFIKSGFLFKKTCLSPSTHMSAYIGGYTYFHFLSAVSFAELMWISRRGSAAVLLCRAGGWASLPGCRPLCEPGTSSPTSAACLASCLLWGQHFAPSGAHTLLTSCAAPALPCALEAAAFAPPGSASVVLEGLLWPCCSGLTPPSPPGHFSLSSVFSSWCFFTIF